MKQIVFLLFILAAAFSCVRSDEAVEEDSDDQESNVVFKRRKDGTISSANQVDENNMVHGMRVSYYGDGKTVRSRISVERGIKQGPAIKYYNNGQVFEHINYKDGEKHGPCRKYHKNGQLLAVFEYNNGITLPGLKEYGTDGVLVRDYPEVQFREIDQLASKNRIDLEIVCSRKRVKMKYFILEKEQGDTSRIYLITENGVASQRYYLRPGETLDKRIDIIAEIPTEFGNILVKELSYHLTAKNIN